MAQYIDGTEVREAIEALRDTGQTYAQIANNAGVSTSAISSLMNIPGRCVTPEVASKILGRPVTRTSTARPLRRRRPQESPHDLTDLGRWVRVPRSGGLRRWEPAA